MKITKRQLKRIIREERAYLLNEAPSTAQIENKIFEIIGMMARMSRVELEELRDRKSRHFMNGMIRQLAQHVLNSQADSTLADDYDYMGG